MSSSPARIDCAGICDGAGLDLAPASLLIAPSSRANAPFACAVLAAGTPDHVARHPEAAAARRIHLPDTILFPGLVNAHTHLDLTHLGPRPHDPLTGFTPWVRMIRDGRRIDPREIEASVWQGVERSLAGAVVAVGDIAGVGSTVPLEALRASPLRGVSYIECFGTGARQEAAADRLGRLIETGPITAGGVRMGLQPHAPYSAGLRLYAAAVSSAAARRVPLTTHLAETPEEFEFIAHATGPLRDMLEELGVWDDACLDEIGRGFSPVRHLEPLLNTAPFTLAHVNHVSDDDIAILARSRAVVVYCPRAHTYFGHEQRLGPHPWRRLLAAGVTVALGADSIVSLADLPGDPAASQRLSVLDDMRLLRRRDLADPITLLRMATTAGAAALHLRPAHHTFAPGLITGVAAVTVSTPPDPSPAAAILDTAAPPRLLNPAHLFDHPR